MARRELEADIEGKCVEHALEQGCENVKLDKIKKGWPDQMFFLPNSGTLLVEFKRPGEKARKKQLAVHRRLAALGHPVTVIFSYETFCELLSCELALSMAAAPSP